MNLEDCDCCYADMYDMHDAADREEYEAALIEELGLTSPVHTDIAIDTVLDGDDLPY